MGVSFVSIELGSDSEGYVSFNLRGKERFDTELERSCPKLYIHLRPMFLDNL